VRLFFTRSTRIFAVSSAVLVCLVFVLVNEVTSAHDSLAEQRSRGRQIYVQGTSRSGKDILAYVGEGSLEVPGSTMPCAGCHGLDGRGKPEGGINPTVLTWETLTKPYGLTHPNGRKHPAYTERALGLAITRGIDPGGNKLLNVMPRYVMSREDMADLIAYLQLLGKDLDPGLSENKIVIATISPSSGPLAEMAQAINAVTRAVFEELNSQGGVYERRLELKVIESGETPDATRAKVDAVLKEQQVFAMTGAVIAGLEKQVVPLLAQHETPLIGPLTLFPQTGSPLNRQVFYLLSGLDGQSRSLINFVAKTPELKNAKMAVVFQQSEIYAGILEAIKDQNKNNGLPALQTVEYTSDRFDSVATVNGLRQAGIQNVFFLGNSNDALSFMNEAGKLNWFPTMLGAGTTMGGEVFGAPVEFDRKVFITFPTAPEDQTAAGLSEFRALAEKYKLPATHRASQVSAYAAAKILVEALKRAGKDVSREKLIQTLEEFREYSTGLTPAITYGPSRRVGAMGAYVVTMDLKEKHFVPAGGWVDGN